jgi:hypothetical protein
MFEVSFSPKQRKNYLFYCLLYLFRSEDRNIGDYYLFVSSLAEKYLKDVYLNKEKLNQINVPLPNSFDSVLLSKEQESESLTLDTSIQNSSIDFNSIFGDGTQVSKGIPVYIFNYLDYKIWEKYFDEMKGREFEVGDNNRIAFFESLGCSDFDLNSLNNFYFSRTRNSLEHFFAQALATGTDGRLNKDEINCFGNYAMIGSEANSSASDWSPKGKLIQYLDISGKIKNVSIASLKFLVMMKKCKENEQIRPEREWIFVDIKLHQEKMVEILTSI